MQFYVADYLADTMHLSAEEHGAYLLLIFNYWQTGKPIPKTRLAKIARLSNERWSDVEQSLSEFFKDADGCWTHERIEADLQAATDSQAQRAAAGKASAEARKSAKRDHLKGKFNDRSTPVEGSSNEKSTNKEEIRQDNTTDKNTGPSADEPAPDKKSPSKRFTEAEFDEFWKTCRDNWHGRPGHKFEAKAEFKKLYRSEHDLERMKRLTLQECEARKAQHRQEGFAEAMKHVCRWIKVQGWEDVAENPTNVSQFRRPEQENRPYREAMPRPDRAPQRPTGTGGDS